MGKDDELKAPSAKLLDRLDGLATAMAVMTGKRIVENDHFAREVAVMVELGEKECERQGRLVAGRKCVAKARHRVGHTPSAANNLLSPYQQGIIGLSGISGHAVRRSRDASPNPKLSEIMVDP